MHSVKIQQVTNPDEWSANLHEFISSVFITDSWLQGVKSQFATPVYLNFTSDNENIAKIAGLSIRGRKNKPDVLFFYSGMAFRKAEESLIRACHHQLVAYARKQGYDKLIIESVDHHEGFVVPIPDLKLTWKRNEYVLDLTTKHDLFHSKFNKTLRKKVRRAERSGSVVRESKKPELLKQLIECLKETRKIRMGKGYPEYNFLPMKNLNEKALALYLRNGLATMFYVMTNDEINSVLYVLLHGKRAFLLLIGTTGKGYDLHSPVFLYYHTLCSLIERGFTSCNLGGVTPNTEVAQGLGFLKKSMGARKVELHNYKSYFLKFPLELLNPALYLFDMVPDNKFKKMIKNSLSKKLN